MRDNTIVARHIDVKRPPQGIQKGGSSNETHPKPFRHKESDNKRSESNAFQLGATDSFRILIIANVLLANPWLLQKSASYLGLFPSKARQGLVIVRCSAINCFANIAIGLSMPNEYDAIRHDARIVTRTRGLILTAFQAEQRCSWIFIALYGNCCPGLETERNKNGLA
jgi:hypothetical protein